MSGSHMLKNILPQPSQISGLLKGMPDKISANHCYVWLRKSTEHKRVCCLYSFECASEIWPSFSVSNVHNCHFLFNCWNDPNNMNLPAADAMTLMWRHRNVAPRG